MRHSRRRIDLSTARPRCGSSEQRSRLPLPVLLALAAERPDPLLLGHPLASPTFFMAAGPLLDSLRFARFVSDQDEAGGATTESRYGNPAIQWRWFEKIHEWVFKVKMMAMKEKSISESEAKKLGSLPLRVVEGLSGRPGPPKSQHKGYKSKPRYYNAFLADGLDEDSYFPDGADEQYPDELYDYPNEEVHYGEFDGNAYFSEQEVGTYAEEHLAFLSDGGLDMGKKEACDFASELIQSEQDAYFARKGAQSKGHGGFSKINAPPFEISGSISLDDKRARLRELKARTTCKKCGAVGHIGLETMSVPCRRARARRVVWRNPSAIWRQGTTRQGQSSQNGLLLHI